MTENKLRYQQTWSAESTIIALWLTPLALLLLWGAWAAAVPLLIRLAMGGAALLLLLIVGAALIRTTVTVDAGGNLLIRKTFAGLPITLIPLDGAGIIRVELERMTFAGSKERADAKTATPKFRLDILHAQGKFFVVASTQGGRLKDQAVELATALHCPMQRVG